MHRVEVDISEVVAFEHELDSALKVLPAHMLSTVQETGAREAQQNHRYRNRTGNLQASTDAYLTESTDNEIAVTLGPTAEYAVFVANRGYLDMEHPAELAERGLDGLFADLPE